MANRRFTQFYYSLDYYPVFLHVGVPVTGSSGQLGTPGNSGGGITSVVRKTTGVWQVNLADNYFSMLGLNWHAIGAPSGTSLASSALATNTIYQIQTLGTTNWVTAGLPSYLTAATGMAFVAAATASGTGTAAAVIDSGIYKVEFAGAATPTINPASQRGGEFLLELYNKSGSLADPVQNSTINIHFTVKNSSVKI